MGKWGKWVSWKNGQKKWTLGKGKGKEESGKGRGENVGAGKVGKLNDHHTKQPYVAPKTKWEKWGKCEESGKNVRRQHQTTKGLMQKCGHPLIHR